MSLFKRKKKEKNKQIPSSSSEAEEGVISRALDVALSEDNPKLDVAPPVESTRPLQLPTSGKATPIQKEKKVDLSSSMIEALPSTKSVTSATTSSETRTVLQKRQLPGGVVVRPEVQQILPTWIEKKYYWARPNPHKHADLYQSWLEEWSNFLMKWAEATRSHVVSVPQLLAEFPFNNPINKAKLLEPEIREICEYLIQKKLAKWYDKNKRRLRIYWKSLEEFAEDLYDWAFLRGESFATLMDLAQAGQPWSNLPPRELQQLMELLVREGRAEWADEEKRTIQFVYE